VDGGKLTSCLDVAELHIHSRTVGSAHVEIHLARVDRTADHIAVLRCMLAVEVHSMTAAAEDTLAADSSDPGSLG